jgi:heterodisulfide reductase subunit A
VTERAKAVVACAVFGVPFGLAAVPEPTPVNPLTLVLGGGVAGIQASLEIAEAGQQVVLVEKTGTIGGHMAMFDKTFPTLDCAACILTPKMTQVGKHKNIHLMAYSEVEEVSGFIGNFTVKVRRKASYVDTDKCTGCGTCWENCPGRRIPAVRVIRKDKQVIGRTRPAAAAAAAPRPIVSHA